MRKSTSALLLLALVLCAEVATARSVVLNDPIRAELANNPRWTHRFRTELLKARDAPLPSLAAVEVEAKSRAELVLTVPVAVALIGAVISVGKRLVAFVQKANTLYETYQSVDHKSGTVYRDVTCRTATDAFKVAQLLGKHSDLLHRLAGLVFQAKDKCYKWENDCLPCEPTTLNFNPLTTGLAGGRVPCPGICSNTKSECIAESVEMLKSSAGNSPEVVLVELADRMGTLFDQVYLLGTKVTDVISKAQQAASATCKAGIKPKSEVIVSPEGVREVALSAARVDYLVDVGAMAQGSPSMAAAASVSGTFQLQDWAQLPSAVGTIVGAQNTFELAQKSAAKGLTIAQSKAITRAEHEELVKAVQEGRTYDDAKAKAMGAQYVKEVTEKKEALNEKSLSKAEVAFASSVMESTVTLAETLLSRVASWVADKVSESEVQLMESICDTRLNQARLLVLVETLQSAQEDLYEALAVPEVAKQLNAALFWDEDTDLPIMRKLYSQQRGNTRFGELVQSKTWYEPRCRKFFNHFVKDGDVEHFVKSRCPVLMQRVAMMADPDFAEMDVFLVLFDDAADLSNHLDTRDKRYQRALFNVQRKKIAKAIERVPQDFKDYGCSPFHSLQIMFERQHAFLHAADTSAKHLEAGSRDVAQQIWLNNAIKDTAKPMCKVSDMAYCVAAAHYARCHPKQHKASESAKAIFGESKQTPVDLGGVLKRAYMIHRIDHPWKHSIAVQNDPLPKRIADDAKAVEKGVYKELFGGEQHVSQQSSRAELIGKLKERAGVQEPLAWNHATFKQNVAKVVHMCSKLPLFKSNCRGHEHLTEWMGAPTGPFRTEMVFDDLGWLGAVLFARANLFRESALPNAFKLTNTFDFVPLGCGDAKPPAIPPSLPFSLYPDERKKTLDAFEEARKRVDEYYYLDTKNTHEFKKVLQTQPGPYTAGFLLQNRALDLDVVILELMLRKADAKEGLKDPKVRPKMLHAAAALDMAEEGGIVHHESVVSAIHELDRALKMPPPPRQ